MIGTLNKLRAELDKNLKRSAKDLQIALSNLEKAKRVAHEATEAHASVEGMVEQSKGLFATMPTTKVKALKTKATKTVAVAPKKRGRPKKEVVVKAVAAKASAKAAKIPKVAAPKKRGRPKKVVEAAAAPKRGPGRPKKVVEAAATAPKKRGRPKKVVAETAAAAPKKRGRPKKEVAASSVAAAPKKRGRPKKEATADTVPKKRGRPKNEESQGTLLGESQGTLLGSVKAVMGSSTLGAKEILAGLKAIGATPDSNNPVAMVHTALSIGTKKGLFEKVQHGKYRVAKPAATTKPAVETAPAAAPTVVESVDDVMASLGYDPGELAAHSAL